MPRALVYVLCIFVSFLPALSGIVAGPGQWYQQLVKPVGNPPPWVFGPVWTTLYLLIGISAALAFKTNPGKPIILLFLAHLLLNAAWSPLFFGLQQPSLALVDLIALDIVVALLLWKLWPAHRTAAYCLIPYQLWILYATYLNTGILVLNQKP